MKLFAAQNPEKAGTTARICVVSNSDRVSNSGQLLLSTSDHGKYRKNIEPFLGKTAREIFGSIVSQ
jgi:hypothetical protein